MGHRHVKAYFMATEACSNAGVHIGIFQFVTHNEFCIVVSLIANCPRLIMQKGVSR